MIGDLMLYPDAVAAVDGAPAEWYVDASAVFRIDEQLELFGGIDNLFDNKPPILGTAIAGDANTDPSLYDVIGRRSEEHTSELQSLMRISYAVFCLKKKKTP